jgi:hypothetical protein
MWRNESAAIRHHFQKLAEEEKAKHQISFPNYKCSPRKSTEIKKRKTSTKTAPLILTSVVQTPAPAQEPQFFVDGMLVAPTPDHTAIQPAGYYISQAEPAAQPNATEQSPNVAESALQSAISLVPSEPLLASEASQTAENEQNSDAQFYEDLRIALEGELGYSVRSEINLSREDQLQALSIQREVEAQVERDTQNINNWSSALDYTSPAYDFLHSGYTYEDDQA